MSSPEQRKPERPLVADLLTIHTLWKRQLDDLESSGLVDQAAAWAEEEQWIIDRRRTHVFVDVDPTEVPWGGAIPDGLIAMNGIVLSGTRDNGTQLERRLIPVHVGMYFEDTFQPDKRPLRFGSGSLMEPPQTVVGGYDDAYGQLLHQKAMDIQMEAQFDGLPLDDNLSLSPPLLDLAFAYNVQRD